MSVIASKKIDFRVKNICLQRTRGFLMRKSMVKERKWTHSFYYLKIPL